jgi:hypothetical protein
VTRLRFSALLVAVVIAGCGVGAGESEDGGATLLVTRDFGVERLGDAKVDTLRDGETVMRAMQRQFDVKTRYGGNFIQAIDDLAGGREDGRPVDWFYYVNGVEAEEGAGSRELSPGDRVWWDRHDWGEAMRIPAVVGSYPEPFLNGINGEKLPVRVDCAPAADRECDEVAKRLISAGVKRASKSSAGSPVGERTLRVVVGLWRDIRTDGALARMEVGPKLSGVYVKFQDRGARMLLLDAEGRTARTVAGGAGLVAATRYEEQAPTWVVTGVDAAGLAAAASAFEEGVLAEHFALAIVDGRGVGLPARGTGAP